MIRAGLLAVLVYLVAAPAEACRSSFRSGGIPTSFVLGYAGFNAMQYSAPTDIYGHAIMGNLPEARRLDILFRHDPDACKDYRQTIEAGTDHVFEDIAPRAVDLDGDRYPEIITVRSSLTQGAQIAIYGPDFTQPVVGLVGRDYYYRLIATTPYIGRRYRWLAPIGAADLDGDGHIEIAYIDRPHLAKTLRVWRFRDGALTQVTAASGLTNHRIGEEYISGGIRDCGQGPEMITADANWTNIMATRLVDDQLQARIIGPHEGRQSFDAALSC